MNTHTQHTTHTHTHTHIHIYMHHLSILHAVCNATETNRTVFRYTAHGAFFKFYFLTLCMRCFTVFSLVLVPRFSLQKSGGHLDLSIQFYIPCVCVCVYGPCASSPPPPPHTHTHSSDHNRIGLLVCVVCRFLLPTVLHLFPFKHKEC